MSLLSPPDFPAPAQFVMAADLGLFALWVILLVRKAPLKYHYAMVCASLGIWLLGLGIACSLLRAFGNTMGETGVGDPSTLARLFGDALIVGASATYSVIKLVALAAIGLWCSKPKAISTATSGEVVS